MSDELIRERLLDLTADLPGGPLTVPSGLVDAARRRHRRRQQSVGVLVALTVLVLSASLALAVPHRSQQGPQLTPATADATTSPSLTQQVDFYGVRIDVPTAWKIDATRCGTPVESTVVRDNGQPTAACGFVGSTAGLTVVHMTHPGLYFGGAYAHLAKTPAMVGGMRALTGKGRPDNGSYKGPFVQVAVLLDQAVVVAVEGPDHALAAQLLRSLRPADVDAAGCQRRILTLTPIGDAGLGARDTFMPTGYQGLTACRYQDNSLTVSSVLTAAAADRLVAALDAAPLGRSQPDRTACPAAQGTTAGWVIRGSYLNAPTREIFINAHPCHKRFIINGGRIAQLTPTVTAALPDQGR